MKLVPKLVITYTELRNEYILKEGSKSLVEVYRSDIGIVAEILSYESVPLGIRSIPEGIVV